MKRKLMIFFTLIGLIYLSYKVDKVFFMPERVRRFTWIYSDGYSVGDVINPERYTMSNDTIYFSGGGFVRVRYQFFDRLVISDSANGRNGTYEKIGSHWDK